MTREGYDGWLEANVNEEIWPEFVMVGDRGMKSGKA
jgi:hypothetical protein